MKQLYPWIGITDFATQRQVANMLHHFVFETLFLGRNSQRRLRSPLMIGVMMSYKTLNNIPTKWKSAWVPKEDIQYIFQDNWDRGLNTLHYADFDGLSTVNDLTRAALYCGPNLDAIQFDMIWPAVDLLEILKENCPEVHFILQVNAHAFEQVNNEPSALLARLSEYSDIVNGVLLDKSMGRGLGLDAEWLKPFVEALVENRPDLTVGVAGGLGPDSLHLLEPLRPFFSKLAIDAQGKLRRSGSALDPIDWDLAEMYISKALHFLG